MKKMITVNEIISLENNDGMTLRNYQSINYKSGYQVATEGIETTNPYQVIKCINDYKGNCGIWKSEGIYYVDKCQRISTKAQALKIGREHKQQSIFKWANKSLIWC